MRNVRSTISKLLPIIFLFRFCIISGSANYDNQKAYSLPVETLIEDLIFNAQYDQAIIETNKALNQTPHDSYSRLRLLLKLGEISIFKNDPQRTSEILREVEKKKNGLNQVNNQIEFLYFLEKAMLLREYGKNEEAPKCLEKSLIFLNKIENPKPIYAARLYDLLGRNSYENRDSIKAIRYFKKSIHVLSGNSLQEKIAKITSQSYIQLAYLFSGNTKMAEKAEAMTDSAYLNIANKNHPSLLNFYLTLSFIYLNYNLKVNRAEISLRLATNIINKYFPATDPDYGLIYCYKGQLAYQEHDSEKAMGYFRQAEIYLLKNKNLSPYMYLFYFDLANTYYFYKNDFNRAIAYYRNVINNDNQWLKRAHINSLVLSGYCYLELGDTAKAISYIKNGILAAQKGSRVSGREKTYSYRCLAGLYLNIKQEELAYRYFRKAYEKAKEYNVGWDLEADIITNLANYHRDKGDFHTALNLYQTAINKAFYDSSVFSSGSQFCDEIELIEILNNKGYALFQLYEKKDKNYLHLRDALSCQNTAIRLLEKRLGYLDSESSEYNWLALAQTTLNNAVLYSTLLYNQTHDLSYADAGFQFAEKSRMMVILIASWDKKIKKYAGVPDSLIQKEIQLHNEILNLQNQLYTYDRTDTNSQKLNFIAGKLAQVQLENDKIKSLYEIYYKSYFNLKDNLTVINLFQIQQYLRTDQILLEYQLLESELIIIAISKECISMQVIKDNGNVKRLINKFYKTIAENPSNKDPYKTYKDFTEISHSLYSWLIEPIKMEIKNKRLIIIPHDELNLVPFELLTTEMPSTEKLVNYNSLPYLIKNNSISYGYSGTLLFEETKLRPGKIAAFFIPDYSQGTQTSGQKQFMNLKGTQKEAKKIRDLIGGDLFTGNNASETRFKLIASDYKILHIASHTSLDPEIPTLSSLELPTGNDTLNDGVLYSYELYQLQLKAQLIVLSGCSTGIGQLKQGEGLLSLSRSFFYSGVRSVAFSLWPQADQISADIMIGFYKGIKNKKRLDDALQSSKLNYLSLADPAKTHPYFWGGFLIVGRTDQIILNHKHPKITYFLILLCFIIGGLTYHKFKS